MPSVRGRRPTATSSSSPSRPCRRRASTRTRPSSRLTRVTFASQQISTPWAASPSWTAAEANGSSRGRMRWPPSSRTTSLPSVAHAWASSTPTGPPPSTSRRPGASFAVVAARFVHGRASASPSIGGRRGVRPGRQHDRALGHQHVVADAHAALALEARPRRGHRDAAILQPRDHHRVVEVVDDLVAARERDAGGELAGRRLRRARHAARLVERLRRAQERLGRHAGVERALAADRGAPRRSRPAGRPRRAFPRTPRPRALHRRRPRRIPARPRGRSLLVLGGGRARGTLLPSRVACLRPASSCGRAARPRRRSLRPPA